MSRGNKISSVAVLPDIHAYSVGGELFVLCSLAPSLAVIVFHLPARSH